MLALLAAAVLVVRDRRHPQPATPLEQSGWADVLVHAAAFVIANTFIWAQDVAIGEGVNYAPWVTIPWAIGLTVHTVLTYLSQRDRSVETRGSTAELTR